MGRCISRESVQTIMRISVIMLCGEANRRNRRKRVRFVKCGGTFEINFMFSLLERTLFSCILGGALLVFILGCKSWYESFIIGFD